MKYLILLFPFAITSCSTLQLEDRDINEENTLLEKYREERNAGQPAGHEAHCKMMDTDSGGIAITKDIPKSLCH